MKTDMVANLCTAVADLIHDHPQAAEYTARKLGRLFELEAQRAEVEQRERDERRRSTGNPY